MGAGTFDGNDLSVYYAGATGEEIYRTTVNGTTERIAVPENGVADIADVGDGDDTAELVFADGPQAVRYVTPTGETGNRIVADSTPGVVSTIDSG